MENNAVEFFKKRIEWQNKPLVLPEREPDVKDIYWYYKGVDDARLMNAIWTAKIWVNEKIAYFSDHRGCSASIRRIMIVDDKIYEFVPFDELTQIWGEFTNGDAVTMIRLCDQLTNIWKTYLHQQSEKILLVE